MKNLFAALAMVMVFAFAVPATASFCPQGQELKGWKCVDVEVPQSGNHNSNSNENSNKNYNTNLNNNMNTNLNSNENRNSNKNVNINAQDQKQGQDQKQIQDQNQAQLQGQGQEQSAEANNAGNTQETDIVIEGDTYEAKPNHIQGPPLMQPDAKFSDTKEFSFRLLGSVWSKVLGLEGSQARNLGLDSDDVKIERALMTKMSKQSYLAKGKPSTGLFLGTLYVWPTGRDVTVAGIEGIAADAAMKHGATHAVFIYDFGVEATGKSWSVGVGGGASIVADAAGNVMIAPNGGFGFGAAHASNDSLPALVVECYRSEDAAKVNEVK